MKYNVCYFDILRRLTLISAHKNSVSTHIRYCFTTLNGNQANYYDIFDKRDLTDSSAFEKNDQRRSWTNRDDSTSEDYMATYDQIKPSQRSVATYRKCKVTNSRSKVNVAINSMDGDELISGICYNMLGVESDMSLENLYDYFRNPNISRYTSSLGADKHSLLDDFKIQVERLLHHRKLSMDHCVKILLLYDRLNVLSHEMRNLIQSYMYLNLHRFTQFQIITTFEIFGKHRERYENFLNLLCLIFYDHMIPLMRSKESINGSVELGNVLHFLRVLKDFKFKKLTDVLYGHVYDNMELLSTDDMIQVSNTFFRDKKDPNFVEMYTKMLSLIFKIPLMDLYNFENYVQQTLKYTNYDISEANGSVSSATNGTNTCSSDIVLDDMKSLKAIFNCNSEFLLSSVHHRIEFKRLWKYNIKTNNVSWKSQDSSNGRASDCGKLHLDYKEGDQELLSGSKDEPIGDANYSASTVDGNISVYDDRGDSVSYIVNFQNLYEKIEHLILSKFKFQSYTRDYVCNIIATVLDYSRYSNDVISSSDGSTCDSSKAHSILTNLYALLIGLKGNSENTIKELKLISPKTILDHSHVYFYKIDPKCEFYKEDQVNYYKPHLTTYTLFRGDHRLYSLMIRVFTNYIIELAEFKTKKDCLSLCKLIQNVIHPFYCSRRVREKPFLALDMLHMTGNLNKKTIIDFTRITGECVENIEKSLSNGLLGDLISFAEEATKCVSNMLSEDFALSERIQVLKTLSTITICKGTEEQENDSRLKEYIDSTVDKLLEYFRAHDKEDLEDRLTVGHDLKLLDYIADLLALEISDGIYDLLRDNLKLIYLRMEYYSLKELVTLSSCISSSLNHFSKLELEGHEMLESLSQTLKILKGESMDKFYSKSAKEEGFNPQTTSVYNVLMMYHVF